MELMSDFLARHNNIHEHVWASHFDDSQCALMCTLQTRGPWPACKSFDLIVYNTGNTLCRLNILTLEEAKKHGRHDLIDTNERRYFLMWHFEPRSGLIQEQMVIESQLKMAGARLSEAETDVHHKSSSDTVIIVSATLFGIVFGLLLGVGLGKILLFKVDIVSRNTGDDEDLVDNRISLQTLASV